MAKITFIQHSGQQHSIDIEDGISLMQGAVSHNIPGISADCGGSMSCGTCCVSIAPEWVEKAGPPSTQEQELLDISCDEEGDWRLSCQIKVSQDLDGLVVHLPESQ